MTTAKQERAQERFRDHYYETVRSITDAVDAAGAEIRAPETAIELLGRRDFFKLLRSDMERAGLVGEDRNSLVVWLLATSRLTARPLNLVIKGASSAGKNHLARTVFRFFPPDAVVSASSLSKRALNYIGRDALRHKILYVDELSGVNNIHPARQLISEGRLTHRVSVMKNGHWEAEEKMTEGPVACITTTTANVLAIDDETRNFSVWIDERFEQTKAISKAVVSRRPEALDEARLRLWHAVQDEIAKLANFPIVVPPWFVLVVENVLPYGDLRIRRYWPAFVEVCKLVCMVHNAAHADYILKHEKCLTINFEQFAVACRIFDRVIARTMTRAGNDEDLATADIVRRLSKKHGRGIAAGDMVGEPGIRTLDRAYLLLRRAAQAGVIVQVNLPDKNNEKRYGPAGSASFLGTPEYIVRKIGLKIGGTYVDPFTGRSMPYGDDVYEGV